MSTDLGSGAVWISTRISAIKLKGQVQDTARKQTHVIRSATGSEIASARAKIKGIPQVRKIDRKIDRRPTVIRYKLILWNRDLKPDFGHPAKRWRRFVGTCITCSCIQATGAQVVSSYVGECKLKYLRCRWRASLLYFSFHGEKFMLSWLLMENRNEKWTFCCDLITLRVSVTLEWLCWWTSTWTTPV